MDKSEKVSKITEEKEESENGCEGLPGGTVVKNLPASAVDMDFIPDVGRFHMLLKQLSPCATTTEACTPSS